LNKKLLLILLPLVIGFSCLEGIYFYAKPKVRQWLLTKINTIASEKLPVQVHIEDLNWTLLLPEVDLTGIQIDPKPGELKGFPSVTIKKISTSLDFLELAQGRLAISRLIIVEPQATVDLDQFENNNESDKPLPTKQIFELLDRVPLYKLGIRNGSFEVISKKENFDLVLKNADLLMQKQKNSLSYQIDLADSTFNIKDKAINFRLQSDGKISATAVDLSSLKISSLNSFLSAKGLIKDLPHANTSPQLELEIDAFSDLPRLSSSLQTFMKFPDLEGTLRAKGTFKFDKKKISRADMQVTGQQVKISKYNVGDVDFRADLNKDRINIPALHITNEAGLIDIKDLTLSGADENNQFALAVKGHIHTEQIDINELLQHLGLDDLPLELFSDVDLDCSGPLIPKTQVACQGKTAGDQLEVRSGDKKSDIIAWVDHFEAAGGLVVTRQAVSYKTQIKIGQDTGVTDGVISYKDGFKINFATDSVLHFEDFKQLAGLKLEGLSSIKGSTQGDSHAATFNLNMNGQDVVFENFKLGSPTGLVRYEKGHLFFDNIDGTIGSSKYTGQVTVDLIKHRIAARAQSNTFDVQDMLAVFSRRFQMPVSFTGTGSMNVVAEGPFALGQLSYDLNATLFPGAVAGESYDHAEVSLHSDSGQMRVEKALITKNKSQITVTGEGHPNGDINIQFHGSQFYLEESENVSLLGANISGLLNFDMSLKGFVLKPDVRLYGKLTQTLVEEQEFPESDFDFSFSKESISGKTSLAGGQLKSEFAFPLVETAPFYLRLDANKWNYATLFALVGGGPLLNDYEASLTGKLNLSSEKGGIFAASGEGNIEQFQLKRGTLLLQNKKTMRLTMQNGVTSLNDFSLHGAQSFIELKGHDFTRDRLNVRLDGKVNLRLLQIFVPFLEEFSGQATIGIDIAGKIETPEILGTATVENGYVKVKGFPHPFQRIHSDIEFSQSKIIINAFNGTLAGGIFSGDGTIVLAGLRNIPVNIKAHLDNVSLNVPDKVHTNGSGDLTFSGNWFPYTLAGTYHVNSGLMDMELTEGTGTNRLKQSSYLPKVILQSAFEPLLLDLNVILDHPLQVKNSMMEGSVSGQIQVKGLPDQPILYGKVTAEKGTKIIFRDKTFEVQAGNVQFTGQQEINPEVYATAFSRINEYDINIVVQGTAKDPIVRLSSTPPLSQPDIVSLIALGIISQNNVLERQAETSRQQDTSNVQLGAAVFSNLKPVKDLQEQFGVDFQVSSTYDDTRNTSTQTITLSKKLSERLKASASRLTGQTDATAFRLQYSLTPSVSAIGSYENRQVQDQSLLQTGQANLYESILGLDLEFKKEFR